jgi:hypothetical protein
VPTEDLLRSAEDVVHRWSVVSSHPHVAAVREAFVSDELDGTPSLFLAHDYHPGFLSLEQAHMQPAQVSGAASAM